MTAGSSMAAMILNSPPHCGQCSRSNSNTRLSRRAQPMRAVAPRAFELQHDIASAIALQPLNGDRGARDVAAQAFEFLALMRPAAHPGMLTPARI